MWIGRTAGLASSSTHEPCPVPVVPPGVGIVHGSQPEGGMTTDSARHQVTTRWHRLAIPSLEARLPLPGNRPCPFTDSTPCF